jgi:CheY-like chemotaxis protein
MAHASEKRILIVDDEPDPRDLLASCIEYSGFNVETAMDGIDALDRIQANTPDLMILDMRMPRRSGSRLMRALQKNEKWANIPLIAISAYARNQFGYVKIEGLNPFEAENCPENITGKTTSPANLVKTIGMILGVDVGNGDDENTVPTVEQEVIVKL